MNDRTPAPVKEDSSGQSRSTAGLGVAEYNSARCEFERLSEPYIQMKAEIYGAMEIAFLKRLSGELERIERPTFKQIEALNLIDEMVAYLQAKCFTPNMELTRFAEGESGGA